MNYRSTGRVGKLGHKEAVQPNTAHPFPILHIDNTERVGREKPILQE